MEQLGILSKKNQGTEHPSVLYTITGVIWEKIHLCDYIQDISGRIIEIVALGVDKMGLGDQGKKQLGRESLLSTVYILNFVACTYIVCSIKSTNLYYFYINIHFKLISGIRK